MTDVEKILVFTAELARADGYSEEEWPYRTLELLGLAIQRMATGSRDHPDRDDVPTAPQTVKLDNVIPLRRAA